MGRVLPLAFIAVLLCAITASGMEKWWPAHEAELIAVGTLRSVHWSPSLNGLHVRGWIEISEILYGSERSRRLEFDDFICAWTGPSRCDLRAILHNRNVPGEFAGHSAIWMLRRGDAGTWYSSPRAGGWFGHDDLSKRAEYENYVRRYKR